MKLRTSLTWVTLVGAALWGANWMKAGEAPPIISLPTENDAPATESYEVAPPRPVAPRRFRPSGEIEMLPPANQIRPAEVIEVPLDDEPTRPFRGLPPRPARSAAFQDVTPTAAEEVGLPTHANFSKAGSSRTEQHVTLEWIGPDQVKIGQPFTYDLLVRNVGNATATNVVVRDRVPPGMKIVSLDPQPIQDPEQLIWELGTMEPGDEQAIHIELVSAQRGEVISLATVTSTATAESRFRVCEPRIAVETNLPSTAMLGDPVTVSVAISNPGDGQADHVTLMAVMSEGLRHEKGQEFTFDVGAVAPGETRNVQFVCQTTLGGTQGIQVFAKGSGALEAQAESSIAVTEAKLELALDGPSLRYLDRHATYVVRVSNPGDAPAENVKVSAVIPAGFKFAGASEGGRHDFTTSGVNWTVGSIPPGESVEVSYKCLAVQSGEQKHQAVATAGRNLKSETDTTTRVEGISALLLEVVDVDDPVEVGAETAYEIRVTNQGSRDATNVEIHTLIPPEMSVKGAQGPTKHRVEGQEILFAPLPRLAPRADAVFRVFVVGTAMGDVRFRARLISDSLTEPVIEEESTKVYDD